MLHFNLSKKNKIKCTLFFDTISTEHIICFTTKSLRHEKVFFKTAVLTALLFVLASGSQIFAQNEGKPNIFILATGGTIAGSAESGTQAGYTSGQVGIEKMIDAVPGIRELANITGEQVANAGSQDMSIDIRLTLAKRVNELLAKDDVDGIVITHGTATRDINCQPRVSRASL